MMMGAMGVGEVNWNRVQEANTHTIRQASL